MFIYEKDGKLNIEVLNKTQIPSTAVDIQISKADAVTSILVDGEPLSSSTGEGE